MTATRVAANAARETAEAAARAIGRNAASGLGRGASQAGSAAQRAEEAIATAAEQAQSVRKAAQAAARAQATGRAEHSATATESLQQRQIAVCRELRGGAGPVRTGQAGEARVREFYAIGDKAAQKIGGRNRILDGLSREAVTEIKNVKYQALTRQLTDSLEYAQSTGRQFHLYVRPDTTISKPLRRAIENPANRMELRFIS
ncbi:hypothetical protein GTR02_04365 [Kineococcus sp. R8]|uniref:putative toxin n=1 Tax=Kineococcus siccus TaxID=2696567 RepID=UPI001411CD06|nr:putative toxin [Kineococcus siccus]NAZ81047.1 hypothetical protein [Kineococcus siccus]